MHLVPSAVQGQNQNFSHSSFSQPASIFSEQMRQCWKAPDRTTQPQTVFVDSAVAPTFSPAPAGNPIVPAGYIRQIGADGYADTRFLLTGCKVKPHITSFVVPYFSGG